MIADKKEELKKIKLELNVLQRRISELSIPVLIMIDAYSAAGIGEIISELIQEMDPRHFKVNVFHRETETEKRMPKLWRFWNKFPQKGKISIFDKSYYSNILYDYKVGKKSINKYIQIYRDTEKMLAEDGYLVLKFFLDIDEDEQKKRFEKLSNNKSTSFRITKFDLKENKNFSKYKKHFEKIIDKSDFEFAPWIRVDSNDIDRASYEILNHVKRELENKIKNHKIEKNCPISDCKPRFSLNDIDLNTPPIDDKEYSTKLKNLQKEAKNLAYLMYMKKIPTVLVFEGWDAAGKGGAIKRLLKKIDPRGYEVVPISAPSSFEKSLHYLSRFYHHLPKTGHITLFDRSWYGRVMVERIEGFATVCEWSRAFDEINSFERSLSDWGALVMKFFIHIDKDIQLERFEARQKNPLKRYKITDEDWRNREKWNEYQDAISEMIDKTDKEYAPWIIVEGNDKRYARIKVLESFIKSAKDALSK